MYASLTRKMHNYLINHERLGLSRCQNKLWPILKWCKDEQVAESNM